jgi:hypothetical protein
MLGLKVEHLLENAEAAGGLGDVQLAALDQGHPGGVITPILEAPKPFDENRQRRALTHVPDDSAHMIAPCG